MSLLDLLYPPLCYHCNKRLEEKGYFCIECMGQYTLLDQLGHCTKCFCSIPIPLGTCKPCRTISHPFKELGACFDAFGPAKSLKEAFAKQKLYQHSKDIASYLVVQLDRLNYPKFNTITMVPNTLRNPHYIIGKEVAKMLGTTFEPLLRRKLAPGKIFSLKNKCKIINHVVLLIDLEMNTRQTMRSAGWALDEGYMENLYGITFCATLH